MTVNFHISIIKFQVFTSLKKKKNRVCSVYKIVTICISKNILTQIKLNINVHQVLSFNLG